MISNNNCLKFELPWTMPSKGLQNVLGIPRVNMNDVEGPAGTLQTSVSIRAVTLCTTMRLHMFPDGICGTSCNSRLVAMSVSAGLFVFSAAGSQHFYLTQRDSSMPNVAKSPTYSGRQHEATPYKYHFWSCTFSSSSFLPSSHCFYKEGKINVHGHSQHNETNSKSSTRSYQLKF